jgi:hypothetical protein
VTAGFTWAPENGPAKHTVAKKKSAKNSSDPYEQMILTLSKIHYPYANKAIPKNSNRKILTSSFDFA